MKSGIVRSINVLFFCVIVPLSVFLTAGCGGGGGDSAPASSTTADPPATTQPASHPPSISNLQYTPQTAVHNASEAVQVITGSVSFTDQGGDLATVVVTRYNATDQLVGSITTPIQGQTGVTSGTINISTEINTASATTYRIEVYVTDQSGKVSNKLSGNFTVTAPAPAPAPAPTPAQSDVLLGNFTFVYQIISIWIDKVTLNQKSDLKTSEGADVYIGFDATYPNVTVSVGAWSPSISKYAIVTVPTYSSIYSDGYIFSINPDNTLSGCHSLIVNETPGTCYAFIVPASHRSPLGSWDSAPESQPSPMDLDKIMEIKADEDRYTAARQLESASLINEEVALKVRELKAIAESKK